MKIVVKAAGASSRAGLQVPLHSSLMFSRVRMSRDDIVGRRGAKRLSWVDDRLGRV
jgi:hypothetical protein